MILPNFRHRRPLWLLIVSAAVVLLFIVGLWVVGPRVGRWYLMSRVIPRVERRLSRKIVVGGAALRAGRVRLRRVKVVSPKDAKDHPGLLAEQVVVYFDPWRALVGRFHVSKVDVIAPELYLVRHEDGSDNVSDLIRRRDGAGAKGATAGSEPGRLRVDAVGLVGGRAVVDDREGARRVVVERLEGVMTPGGVSTLTLSEVNIDSALVPSTITFDNIGITGRLRERRFPDVTLQGGRFQLLPRLVFSAIEGTLAPAEDDGRIAIELHGSYGGGKAKLWRARGSIEPADRQGRLEIAAANFNLGRVESVLRDSPVIMPERTFVDGRVRLEYADGTLDFGGSVAIRDLNLYHPGLARDPVLDLSIAATIAGRYASRKLEISQLDLESRGLKAQLKVNIERMGPTPIIGARLQIPEIPCKKALAAFPPAMVPELQGFVLKGNLKGDMRAFVDFEALDDLKLSGSTGIDGCRVKQAPPAMDANRLNDSFEQTVEVFPGKMRSFYVGPENPDFVPLSEVSVHAINAFLTTEDASFFRHQGFIRSQFAKALARNLKRGSFRLGASTISMQLVKNVMLSPEKTLSRKLQELFLVWYVERHVDKERLMEIYVNVIEFGPGIYGIGPATEHYFGKKPAELNPLEAAFLATMLPSPRRRYLQYCNGELGPKREHHVRRVLKKMYSRGFLTDDEYQAAADSQLVFARDKEAFSVRDCREMVESVLEAWKREHHERLRESVLHAAPKKLKLYVPADQP